MYYLLVYMQLVLATPLLYRLLRRGGRARIVLYAATPLMLIVRYIFSMLGLGQMHIGTFLGTWLIYYLLGLEWKDRIAPWLEGRRMTAGSSFFIFLVCIAVQELEGIIWFTGGDVDLATTQLKLSSMICSIGFILMVMTVGGAARKRLSSCRVLVDLGDASFGIYLCHMLALRLVGKVFSLLGFAGPFAVLAEWLLVLSASASAVLLLGRVLPGRIDGALGIG